MYSNYLVGNLHNIYTKESYAVNGEIIIPDNPTPWKFGILKIFDKKTKYYPSFHVITNTSENHVVRYNSRVNLSTLFIMRKDNKLIIYTNYQTEDLSELHKCDFYYID